MCHLQSLRDARRMCKGRGHGSNFPSQEKCSDPLFLAVVGAEGLLQRPLMKH